MLKKSHVKQHEEHKACHIYIFAVWVSSVSDTPLSQTDDGQCRLFPVLDFAVFHSDEYTSVKSQVDIIQPQQFKIVAV